MKIILQIMVIFAGSVNLLMSLLVLYRLHQPTTPIRWVFKVLISSLSTFLFLAGLLIAVSGIVLKSLPTIALGGCSALIFLIHIIKTTRLPNAATSFENAFGVQWENSVPQERKAYFLANRFVFRLRDSPEPILNRNISFYTIHDSNRQLLCDVWQPPKAIKHSGLGFIYLHGSAWTLLEKDVGTRTFFRYLAAQGHVIMDVAYRLYPETDMQGMVYDAKHAIAWLKGNAAAYGVNPERIVIGGGSAGGHISMLAAYTVGNKQLIPVDLKDVDTSVRGVISLYGPSDLEATFYHTAQHQVTHSSLTKKVRGGMPNCIKKKMGENYHRLGLDKDAEPGMLTQILGGPPNERSGLYSLFSPVAHVHKGCPPTLLIQGEHDIITPVKANRHLHSRLKEEEVPVVMHLLPQTDHAFDLILPKMNPAAHNCYYDVERFLAYLVD